MLDSFDIVQVGSSVAAVADSGRRGKYCILLVCCLEARKMDSLICLVSRVQNNQGGVAQASYLMKVAPSALVPSPSDDTERLRVKARS